MRKLNFQDRLRKSLNTLLETIKRFPYATAFILLAVVTMIVYNHTIQLDNYNDAFLLWLERVAMTSLLSVPIALSIKMFLEAMDRENKAIQFVLRFCALVFFVLYIIYGFPKMTNNLSDNFTFVTMVRYFCLTVFSWGAFFAMPFIFGRNQIEVFTFNVLWRLAVTGLYFGISLLAVLGIIELVEVLFDVVIPNAYHKDIPYVLGAVFISVFFFAGIPKKNTKLPSTHSKFFRILLLYVLMPIIFAYTVVIYAYFFYMFVNNDVPNNVIGNLVLWYSFISIFVLFFSKIEIKDSKWAKLFDTWFPRLLFLPLGMMFYAMFLRINQYGITEPRYYMLVGGGWAFIMTVFLAFTGYNKRKNVIIPITISLVALVTILGPISSYSISKSSQNRRLNSILSKNEIIKDGEIYIVPDISSEAIYEISSIILYFDKNHSIEDITVLENMNSTNEVEKLLGFELEEHYYSEGSTFKHHEFRIDDNGYQFELDDYDLLLLRSGNDNNIVTEKGTLKINEENPSEQVLDSKKISNNDIVITYNGQEIFRKDFLSYYQDVYDRFGAEDEVAQVLSNEELSFVHDFSDFIVKINFTTIMLNEEEGEYIDVYGDYHILVKIK